jgi:ligand-binding SRPBCC domain-containing protein
MRTQTFSKRSEIDAPVETVFAFHEKPEAIMQLTPPWERSEVIQYSGGIRVGAKTILKTYVGPFAQRWEAEHVEYVPNRLFADIQRRGPFAYWYHRHRFEPTSEGTTMMIDEIEYALPFGWLGRLLAGAFVKAKLQRVFDYRHKMLAEKLRGEMQAKRNR